MSGAHLSSRHTATLAATWSVVPLHQQFTTISCKITPSCPLRHYSATPLLHSFSTRHPIPPPNLCPHSSNLEDHRALLQTILSQYNPNLSQKALSTSADAAKVQFLVNFLQFVHSRNIDSSSPHTIQSLKSFLHALSHSHFKRLYERAREIYERRPVREEHHALVTHTLQNRRHLFRNGSQMMRFIEKETHLSRRQVRNLVSYVRYKMGAKGMDKVLKRTVRERVLEWLRNVEKDKSLKSVYDELEQGTELSRDQIREEIKRILRQHRRLSKKEGLGATLQRTALSDRGDSDQSHQKEQPISTFVPVSQNPEIKRDIHHALINHPQQPISELYQQLEHKYGVHRRSLYKMVHNARREIRAADDTASPPLIQPHHQELVRSVILQYDETLSSRQLYDLLEKETGLERQQLHQMVFRERQYHL